MDRYLQAIQRALRDLSIQSWEFIDKGQNNDVLIINGELIFRFPKYDEALAGLETETAILAGIREFLTLEIPLPIFNNLSGAAIGEAFVGYRQIPGEPLWLETFRGIRDNATREALALQLGQFLKELHNVPFEKVILCELPLYDTHEELSDIYARIRDQLFPMMRADACTWASRHFERFLNNALNFDYQPVLRHGDFGTTNVLFESKTERIVGIIDFGSTGLGDPAVDLAGLLSSYGEPFLKRMIKTYPELESFWGRVVFYQGTFALIEALFGIEHGDPEALQSGIRDYV
jgi:aminoglycoside 2''-phosphotransferase